MNRIEGFFGPHRWLSNFWPAAIEFDGTTYPTVEHAYQAWKVNPCQRCQIRRAATPGLAKRIARTLTLRPEATHWPAKVAAMMQFNEQKFSRNPLRAQLVATGNAELIEENNWGDREWGTVNGVGNNRLGTLLMMIRASIRQQAESTPTPSAAPRSTPPG